MALAIGRLIGFVLLALAFSAGAASAAKVTLSGEVTYRERIALPENGSLRISLVDLGDPTLPRVLAEGELATPGQVPLSFELHFDDGVLVEGHGYGIVAEIVAGGAIWFRNNIPYDVDPVAPAEPVSIVVNFAGKIIDPFAKAEVVVSPDLLDVIWRAEEIGGVATDPKVESSLSIAPDMRAGGRGGCNNWFAQAKVDGDGLAFSAVAATRMACAEPVTAQETSFFEALAATRSWRLADDQLYLVDAGGKDMARLRKSSR
jgi:putative lipoprotein